MNLSFLAIILRTTSKLFVFTSKFNKRTINKAVQNKCTYKKQNYNKYNCYTTSACIRLN